MQLVVPAYNEEARLPRTLRELRRHVTRDRVHGGPLEVIVVDNASADATARVAREADSPAMRVHVVSCRRRGKGAAVAAGLAVTTAPVVGFMDADGATALDALDEGRRRLALGAHLAIGSRAAQGADAEVRHSRSRELGARAYRALTAKVVPGVIDTQCGFKMMDGDLGRAIARDLRTHGFSFDVEMLALARAMGARIDEFPVTWTDVPGSTFTPLRHGVGAFGELAAIAWRVRQHRALVLRPDPARVRWVAPVAPVAPALGLAAEA